MPRPEVNRSGEMEVFVRAVELGGFSLAARAAHDALGVWRGWSGGWARG